MSATITGAQQVVTFVFEDTGTFNQDPRTTMPSDSNFKPFGTDETFDSQDRDQNPSRMFRPFNRSADEILEGEFGGSWSMDFTLTNGQWLRFIYGDPTSTSVDSYTEYSFQFEAQTVPRSAHIIEEIHYEDGNVEQTVYTGCLASSADVSVSVGDPVDVSLSGDYADEITRSTSEGEDLIYGDVSDGIGSQPETDARPLHFGNSDLYMDYDGDGTAERKGLIQDADISFEANAEIENELGTRFGVAPSYLQFEPDMSFTRLITQDIKDEGKRRMYGSSTAEEPQESILDAEMEGELQMDAGLSGTNKFVFTLSGTFPDSYSRNNVGDPSEPLEEDIDRYIAGISARVDTSKYNLTS